MGEASNQFVLETAIKGCDQAKGLSTDNVAEIAREIRTHLAFHGYQIATPDQQVVEWREIGDGQKDGSSYVAFGGGKTNYFGQIRPIEPRIFLTAYEHSIWQGNMAVNYPTHYLHGLKPPKDTE